MFEQKSALKIVESPKASCCNLTYLVGGAVGGIVLTVLLGVTFWMGRQSAMDDAASTSWHGIPANRVPPEMLSASASHGGSNMAVCTGLVGDDAEGFFALDFITGDLRGWVYYPKQGAFGGMFMTNVQPQLGQSKNPEYLLVSGQTAAARLGANVKLAQSLIYVVNTRSGYFAAYTAPWNSTLESSAGVPQGGQMIFVSGGQIRESNAGVTKPTVPMNNGAGNNPGGANQAPGGANQDANKPGQPNNKKPK